MRNFIYTLLGTLIISTSSLAQTFDFGLTYGVEHLQGNALYLQTDEEGYQSVAANEHYEGAIRGLGIESHFFIPLAVDGNGYFSLGLKPGIQGVFTLGESINDESLNWNEEESNNLFVNIPVQIALRYGRNAYTSAYSRLVNSQNFYDNFHLEAAVGYGVSFYDYQFPEPFKGSRVRPQASIEVGYKWLIFRYFNQLGGVHVKRIGANDTFTEGLRHHYSGFSIAMLWGIRGGMKRPK